MDSSVCSDKTDSDHGKYTHTDTHGQMYTNTHTLKCTDTMGSTVSSEETPTRVNRHTALRVHLITHTKINTHVQISVYTNTH